MSGATTLDRPAAIDRGAVEEFLFAEADLLDDWKLDEWQALFSEDGRYEVAPLGFDDQQALDPSQTLFLIADDHKRITQRCIRLGKKSAHAEHPRSRTRHLLGNVRIRRDAENGDVLTSASFVVWRVRRTEVMTYMGRVLHRLRPAEGGFQIAWKRACLDLETLKPQGTLSIIL